MFCRNCGKQIPNNTNFCNHCGAAQNNGTVQNTQSNPCTGGQQQSTVSSHPVYTAPHSSNTKKNNTKKKVGIVLVCLQILALIGGISSGTVLGMLISGPAGFFELLGYCAPGIIGAVLIYKANKKEKASK